MNELAFELEKVAHGNPSGLDNTVVTFEQAVHFDWSTPSLETEPMTLVIGDTGIRGDTASAIEGVAAWRAEHRARFEELLGCQRESGELSGHWRRESGPRQER